MRRVLKKIANDDKDLGDISTMADSSVVDVSILFFKEKYFYVQGWSYFNECLNKDDNVHASEVNKSDK